MTVKEEICIFSSAGARLTLKLRGSKLTQELSHFTYKALCGSHKPIFVNLYEIIPKQYTVRFNNQILLDHSD